MSYSLTKEERETFMSTNEADNYWEIYTDTPKFQRRLKKFADEYPDLCKLIREDPELGFTTWHVSKKHCDFRLTKPISERKRQASAENARKYFNRDRSPEKQSKS